MEALWSMFFCACTLSKAWLYGFIKAKQCTSKFVGAAVLGPMLETRGCSLRDPHFEDSTTRNTTDF